jgi:hypothetical protein
MILEMQVEEWKVMGQWENQNKEEKKKKSHIIHVVFSPGRTDSSPAL